MFCQSIYYPKDQHLITKILYFCWCNTFRTVMLPSNSNVSYVSPSSTFPITVSSRWKTMKPIPWGTGVSRFSLFIYLFKQQPPKNQTKTNQTKKKPHQTTTFIQNNLPNTKEILCQLFIIT